MNNAAYMFNEETEEIELMHTEEDVEFQVFKYRVSHSHLHISCYSYCEPVCLSVDRFVIISKMGRKFHFYALYH